MCLRGLLTVQVAGSVTNRIELQVVELLMTGKRTQFWLVWRSAVVAKALDLRFVQWLNPEPGHELQLELETDFDSVAVDSIPAFVSLLLQLVDFALDSFCLCL